MRLTTRTKNWQDLFGVQEIAESKILQVLAAAFLITFLITFFGWSSVGFTSKYANIPCSPHLIESCETYKNILPLTPLPYGYTQSIFYVLLFSFICLGFYHLYKREYESVWIILSILWLYKLYIIYGFGSGNFDYYDLIMLAVFLFTKNKLYWLRVFFLILYFLSSTIKIHEGWILGTYFTSLQTGLPVFGNYLAPIATNIVILSQMIFMWFLLKPKTSILFKIAFFYFLFFHLYSGILVEYRYMITTVPLLVILFWLPDKVPYKKERYFFVSTLFIILLFLQSVAIIIPGDQKLTLEGNSYGMYMFEANHQCIAMYTTHYSDGKTTTEVKQSSDARNRCDPYSYVYTYKNKCSNENIKNIVFTFDHSINGNPFYRIVDSNNLCDLIYIPFIHNTWIKSEQDNPQLIGYPVKNFFSENVSRLGKISYSENGNKIILPGLEVNDTPTLNSVQKFLFSHLNVIKFVYWVIWFLELFFILFYFFFKKK